MKLDESIKERHSCRTYLPFEVTDEEIKKIVEAGRLAPSAKNAQPWKYVCIKTDFSNPDTSKDIAKIMANYYLQNRNNPEVLRAASSVYSTSKIIESCPAIILVFAESDYINRDKMESISDILGIGASVEHMMLKATDLGLGCLWIADTYCVHKEMAEYIENYLKSKNLNNFIDNENRLICAMAIGKMGEPRYKTARKKLDEILLVINN